MRFWIIPLFFFIIEFFTHQRTLVSGIFAILTVLGFMYETLLEIKNSIKKQTEREGYGKDIM